VVRVVVVTALIAVGVVIDEAIGERGSAVEDRVDEQTEDQNAQMIDAVLVIGDSDAVVLAMISNPVIDGFGDTLPGASAPLTRAVVRGDYTLGEIEAPASHI
jgi:hypothetical protein